MISLSNVSVTYQTDAGPHPALSGIDLDIPGGEPCVLIGPTGCGKTTLLFLLAGLVSSSAGSVQIDGDQALRGRRETSLILQQHGLFPWKNALANVTLGLTIRGIPRGERNEQAGELMRELGIWDIRDSYPPQLSGGQKQRVAIARSLVTEPDLLLMDEPFSALDAMTRETLQNLLLRIWKERNFTFLMVSHGIEEAVFLGRRIVVLSERPGHILTVLDNPGMGAESFRLSDEFHRQCIQVRRALEDR